MKKNGFTVIELVIVIAIIAIIASIVVPLAVDARNSANERDAMAMMKKIVVAEIACREMKAIDMDNDGVGEYGTLDELSGFSPIRGIDRRITPSLLPEAYRKPGYEAVVPGFEYAGYYFNVFVPHAKAYGIWLIEYLGTEPIPDRMPDPDLSEQFWCAYAWPEKYGSTGKRVFFMNQEGVLRVFENNRDNPYTGGGLGEKNTPHYSSAFLVADRKTITGQVDDCWKPLVGPPR